MPVDQTISIRIKSWLQFFKKALSGEQQDFTSGSIRRAVFLLAIPMILEMCLESVFAIVDIFFVGRIGRDAVATVTLTESVLSIVYSVAMGLGLAATAVVARRTGEKNAEEASRSAAQAILLGIAVTIVVSLAGSIYADRILQLMGASKSMISGGVLYTRIIFGGSLVIMMLFLINGIFRGGGNASIAMWSLWIANACNIVLCPLMIRWYGLPGAAVATTAGRGLGMCFQLFHLFRGKAWFRLTLKHFVPYWKIIGTIISVAWTGTLQFLISSASWIFMARIIAHFGSATIAGYQVAIRILIFFLLPAWGMSNAAATLVGQNLGAGQPARAEKSVWTTAKYNVAYMALVSLVVVFFSDPIIQFINQDQGVQSVAREALRVISLGYIFYGVGMVLNNAFNGAGDTKTPTLVGLFCFWVFQIPFAYWISIVMHAGPKGVFYAILSAESAISLCSLVLFTRGYWKKKKI